MKAKPSGPASGKAARQPPIWIWHYPEEEPDEGFYDDDQYPDPELSLQDQALKAYFDTVELADVVETRAFGKVTRRVEIYRATNYKGHPRHGAASASHTG